MLIQISDKCNDRSLFLGSLAFFFFFFSFLFPLSERENFKCITAIRIVCKADMYGHSQLRPNFFLERASCSPEGGRGLVMVGMR